MGTAKEQRLCIVSEAGEYSSERPSRTHLLVQLMVQEPSMLASSEVTPVQSDCSPTTDAVHEAISVVCATLDAVRNARQLSTFRIDEAQFNISVMEKMLDCHTDDGVPIRNKFPPGE